MEKKKLGLSDKSKLELSKTVGSGTVKQSFSHGRVKSVAVEVKKVRTFRKNNTEDTTPIKDEQVEIEKKNLATEITDKDKKGEIFKKRAKDDNVSTQDRLKELKENALNDRIARENDISSKEENAKSEVFSSSKTKTISDKPTAKKNIHLSSKIEDLKKTTPDKDDEKNKKTGSKKNRADLKKQLSLGKVNIRRQTGKITVQQAYEDEERQRSLASIRRAREKEKKAAEVKEKEQNDNNNKPVVREVKIPEYITV